MFTCKRKFEIENRPQEAIEEYLSWVNFKLTVGMMKLNIYKKSYNGEEIVW